MTAHSGDDIYYEVCIALDSSDSSVAEQLSDIFVSAIMDFSGEAVEIQGAKIIIRTSKDRQFIDALLAHIGDLSANLSEIWQKPIKTTNTIEIKQNRDWIEEYKKGIKAIKCGRFYIYPPWEKPLGKNSSLGAPFALVENFERSQTISLASRPKFSTNTKLPPQILELDSNSNATESSLRGRIVDSHEAIQTYRHTERSEVSKSSESKTKSESMTQKRINELHRFTQSKKIVCDSQIDKMDSSLHGSRRSAQNDESMDCHDSANPESHNDEKRRIHRNKQSKGLRCCFGLFARETSEIGLGRPSSEVLCENNSNEYPRPNCAPQDEFATKFATINILLEPSLAFGTGHHASTFMCIEAIQALDSQDSLKNKKLLDFGCGSGILALCASKLGAVVDLCDIDESAIVESKKNFNNNNATISHIWQGGIADRVAKKGANSGIYDIIVANIIASVLIEQKDNIALSLKRGGIAVLSGILDIYKDEVLAHFSDFTPLAIRQSDEWICAILQYRKNIA